MTSGSKPPVGGRHLHVVDDSDPVDFAMSNLVARLALPPQTRQGDVIDGVVETLAWRLMPHCDQQPTHAPVRWESAWQSAQQRRSQAVRVVPVDDRHAFLVAAGCVKKTFPRRDEAATPPMTAKKGRLP